MKKVILALALLCAAMISHASVAHAQMVANGCPIGRGTNVQGFANGCYDTVAALNAATVPDAVTFVTTRNYYSGLVGGGANYRYYGSSAPSYGCSVTSNGGTRHWVPIGAEINDKQCGAKVDGVTDDTVAIQGMGTFVAATQTPARFTTGNRVVGVALFVFEDLDGVIITFDNATFTLNVDQNAGAASVMFAFDNVKNITLYGYARIVGNMVTATYPLHGFSGSKFIECRNVCSGFNNLGLLEGEGIGTVISLYRRPAVKISIAARVISGGSGYTDGDVVTLDALPAGASNPGLVLGTYTATVVAGAITALTPLTDGYYPWNTAGSIISWPAPTAAQSGSPLSGGTGTGAIVAAYGEDADPDTMSNGGNLGQVTCTVGYYCIEMQYNGNFFTASTRAKDTFRNAVTYSIHGMRLTAITENNYQDAVVIGSYTSIPMRDTTVNYTKIPVSGTVLCASCNDIRMMYQSGTGNITDTRIRGNINYGPADGTNRGGSFITFQKEALDGGDVTYARYDVMYGLFISGQVTGYPEINSGPGLGAIIGPNQNYPWDGELFANVVIDDFMVVGATTTRGWIYFDSRSFAGNPGLVLGPGFQSSSVVAFSAGLAGAWGTFTTVSPSASFVNKLTTVNSTFPIYTTTQQYVGEQQLYGGTSGRIDVTVPAVVSSYPWTYPSAAGTAGYPLVSGNPMTWGLTPTTCTSGQQVSAINAAGVGTCATPGAGLLTLGSVPFAASGGALTQNNSQFYFDTSTNRLSIGRGGTGHTGAGVVLALGTSGGSNDTSAVILTGTSLAQGVIQVLDTSSGAFRTGSISNTAAQIITNNTSRIGITSAGVVSMSNTTAATSSTTGGLTVAGGLGVAGALWFGTYSAVTPATVASITCNAGLNGARRMASDLTGVATFGGAATGGGSRVGPIFCNGTAWLEG